MVARSSTVVCARIKPTTTLQSSSIMAATQDVEHHQFSSNSCVNGRRSVDYFLLTHHSPGPATLQYSGTSYVNPLCSTMLAQELHLISTQVTQSQGSPSELRVEVTGMYSNPGPMIPDKHLIFPLVLRVNNIPRIKNFFGLKLFVSVSNQATKKKTSSIATKGSTAQWNEVLGTL